jgi:6,7-dimethyl-8-ribityllumazine synthase
MKVKEISAVLKAEGLRVGIVISRFNDFLTRQLLDGALDCLERHGAQAEQVTVAWVPGANELPLAVSRMAAGGGNDVVIALGVVIQGATPHAGLINSQVSRALSQVAMDSGTAVINGVVAADTLEQAIERSGTKAGNKGWHAALAGIEMGNLMRQLG